jgi:hypothetical protein
MAIRYDAHESKFPQWSADAAMSRYVGRQRKFLANSQDQKHHNRAARTWSYTCVAAVTKMRFRQRNTFRESRETDAWDFVISRQRRKLARKIDPAAAWADTEYRILERYAARMAMLPRPQDARWSYVVNRQRQKIRMLGKTVRRRGHVRELRWEAIVRNALYFRLRRAYRVPYQEDDEWRLVVSAQYSTLYERARNGYQLYDSI